MGNEDLGEAAGRQSDVLYMMELYRRFTQRLTIHLPLLWRRRKKTNKKGVVFSRFASLTIIEHKATGTTAGRLHNYNLLMKKQPSAPTAVWVVV